MGVFIHETMMCDYFLKVKILNHRIIDHWPLSTINYHSAMVIKPLSVVIEFSQWPLTLCQKSWSFCQWLWRWLYVFVNNNWLSVTSHWFFANSYFLVFNRIWLYNNNNWLLVHSHWHYVNCHCPFLIAINSLTTVIDSLSIVNDLGKYSWSLCQLYGTLFYCLWL